MHPVAEAPVVRHDHLVEQIRRKQFASLRSGVVGGDAPRHAAVPNGLMIQLQTPNARLHAAGHHVVGGLLLDHQHRQPRVQGALSDVVGQQGAEADQRNGRAPAEKCLVGAVVQIFRALLNGSQRFGADGVGRLPCVGVDVPCHGRADEVEVEPSFRHAGERLPGGVAMHPASIGLFGDDRPGREVHVRPGRQRFGHAVANVGKLPRAQAAIQRHDVDVQTIQHLRLHVGQQLHGVEDPRRRPDAQTFLELLVQHGRNPRGPHGPQIDRHPIRPLIIHRSPNPFP